MVNVSDYPVGTVSLVDLVSPTFLFDVDLMSHPMGESRAVVLVQHLLVDEKPLFIDEFRALQLDDEWCSEIITCLESDHPGEKVKQHIFLTRGYNLIKGVLYRLLSGQESLEPRLCIPLGMRNRIIWWNHSTLEASHPGILGTNQRILAKYYWPGMRKDIAKYIEK